MKFQKQLSQLISTDDIIKTLPRIEAFCSAKDHNHLNRRLQQRAISWDMIKLALAYGKQQYHSGATTWTLLDKSLEYTPYARFIDKLRGLRIIAANYSSDNTLKLSTAYWAYDLRR
ncbi:MAG TPA: hypothetical protein DEG17_23815 [Cyanobacteria bacterium UBA11149]|nr:hypothetical protein [Cyanobacteria bacterium UBA11367]HBE60829.1 hypothetical protein [Cyanobacteria bacterium UBA11366]HBK66803.1 hypothetical protein [Cyanobacteria bacterium UBA11166]HBR74203.1 hypothetical protein [Cyanobacteria bacterium UBA11159]HBS70443.1 hypothetical protein [Cyanobacteria bacterium UBA11153]HBW91809.1 hypothetical protein [Cyanobacteria bacterium UBA11149]HCA94164.1 hypothetical protein [Cyanobacteria bacterium UBA9226]